MVISPPTSTPTPSTELSPEHPLRCLVDAPTSPTPLLPPPPIKNIQTAISNVSPQQSADIIKRFVKNYNFSIEQFCQMFQIKRRMYYHYISGDYAVNRVLITAIALYCLYDAEHIRH